LDYSNQSHLVA
jgi:formamidopyrimidine-DNA glycosylase